MNTWLQHFRRNQMQRPEPDWQAPVTLDPEVISPLVRSLEQFELGDGGGPGYLIAWDREKFLTAAPNHRELVDLWFREEHEHSRLLGDAVLRFGGQSIQSHWSFSTFCLLRCWLGVDFELTVLLLTEIVSTAYYRLLRRHCPDPALRTACELILRDESGHVRFHGDRLLREARAKGRTRLSPWRAAWMHLLMLGAGTMLWINHRPALVIQGATTAEFYQETHKELRRFIGRLRRGLRGGKAFQSKPTPIASSPTFAREAA